MRHHRPVSADGPSLKRDVVAFAKSLGFERVGIAPADPLSDAEAFLGRWLKDGRAGDMDYMNREPARRARPAELLPNARSVLCLAANYYPGDPPDGRDGRIARYAWGRDYHNVLRKRLQALVRYLEALAPGVACKTFVDTGPLLERALAREAGIGFVGKNTMLITRGLGSWVFLASVITTLDLPPDVPDTRSCGDCTLCIDACPTQAITEPYNVDARRCIAYLTIELDSTIGEELRPQTGEWLFGCDVCQEVCPHNTRIPRTAMTEFLPASPPTPLPVGEGGAPQATG